MKSTAQARYLLQREIDGEEAAAAAAHRRLEVARLIQGVGRWLHVFNYKDEYLPPVIDKAMRECEAAFSDDDYDHAEHLAKVVKAMVARVGPQFAADPQMYIMLKELHAW